MELQLRYTMLLLSAFLVCIALDVGSSSPLIQKKFVNVNEEINEIKSRNDESSGNYQDDWIRQGQTQGTGVGLTDEDFTNAMDVAVNDTSSDGTDDEIDDVGSGSVLGTPPGPMIENEEDPLGPPSLHKKSHVKPWPKAEIFYEIYEPSNKSLRFSKEHKARIAASVCLIELRSCVRFIFRGDEKDYVSIQRQTNPSSCSGKVGKIGGKQILKLAPKDANNPHSCFDVPGPGAHELLHAVGFFHEHQRTDRDKYIKVHFNNIIKKRWSQFEYRYPPSATYAGNLTYDLTSIMQYSEHGFAKKGKLSMTPLDTDVKKLGQRKDLTNSDIKRLNIFYNCKHIGHKKWKVGNEHAKKSSCKHLKFT